MASPVKAVLGCIAFAIFWFLAVFPAVPFLPVGRTAGSLLGAMLMVIFHVISPDEAYAAIDLQILGLLFGIMIVSVYLERADMFKYLGRLLSWKSRGGKDLLCRICLISAISSALFTNDTSCVVLTEFVLKIARQNNLPPQPFLLALASSANIGSSATPIGNPQNLVIAVRSKIEFGKFLAGILPAMLVGVVVNAVLLLCLFWRVLSIEKDEEAAPIDVISEDNMNSHRFSPATMSHFTSLNSQAWGSMVSSLAANVSSGHFETLRSRGNRSESDFWTLSGSGIESNRSSIVLNDETGGAEFSLPIEDGDSLRTISLSELNISHMNGQRDAISIQPSNEREGVIERWKHPLWKTCVYLITIGMLVSLLMGLNMSWTAITAALALVVLDFKDAQPCLEKVSYSLLIFFCGMFITIKGFNETGIPGILWDAMEPYAQVNRAGGIAMLALAILVLSNFASNVPTVLLLGVLVAESAKSISPADETKAWLILAWVSTVAGNLSLLGSAANMIVCEQARRAKSFSYTLSFWGHLRFGLPSTLIVIAIGLPLIRG